MDNPFYRLLGGHKDRVRVYASYLLWYGLLLDDFARSDQDHVALGYDIFSCGWDMKPSRKVRWRDKGRPNAVGP